MKLRSPLFGVLAQIYEESAAGLHGLGKRDVQPTMEALCTAYARRFKRLLEGEAFELAVTELRNCDGKFLTLEWDDRRARTSIHKVRLSPACEAEFYAALGRQSPTQLRQQWSEMFLEAAIRYCPTRFAVEWEAFCLNRAERSIHWNAMEPFQLHKLHEGQHLLEVTMRLLDWSGQRNLIRWVSSHLTGHSKTLENRMQSREALLAEASGGKITSFEAHGILPMPGEARISGPVRLSIEGQTVDCDALEVTKLPLGDLKKAMLVDCTASRCLTVENVTVFSDLARKKSGEIIVWTSFPNDATLAFLALLPPSLEFHHFGDTDPSGFHILQDLCQRSHLPFAPFRMHVRARAESRAITPPERALLNQMLHSHHLAAVHSEIATLLESGRVGAFEQEDHQPAPLSHWPFYPKL